MAVPGAAGFGGASYTVEGAGSIIGGTNDAFHVAYVPMTGDARITARVTPQVSSQFSLAGVMMRQGLTGVAAQVSLLLAAQSSANIEAPGWKVSLLIRQSAGAVAVRPSAGPRLKTAEPVERTFWIVK